MVRKIRVAMGVLWAMLLAAVVLLIATWAAKPENWNAPTDVSAGIALGAIGATWVTTTLLFRRR